MGSDWEMILSFSEGAGWEDDDDDDDDGWDWVLTYHSLIGVSDWEFMMRGNVYGELEQ